MQHNITLNFLIEKGNIGSKTNSSQNSFIILHSKVSKNKTNGKNFQNAPDRRGNYNDSGVDIQERHRLYS